MYIEDVFIGRGIFVKNKKNYDCITIDQQISDIIRKSQLDYLENFVMHTNNLIDFYWIELTNLRGNKPLWFEKKKLKLHNEQIIDKKIISNYNKIEQENDYTMNLLKQL